MKRNRNAIVWISAFAALGWASLTAADIVRDGNTWSETITEERLLEPGGDFRLRNSNGSIDVQSWDEPMVRIEARKEMKIESRWWSRIVGGVWTEEEALERFAALEVRIEGDTSEVAVNTAYPSGDFGLQYRVKYTVSLPRNVHAQVRTSNGKIEVRGVTGEVEAKSSNGKIIIADVSGRVMAESSNGSILCEGVAGPVDARTSNGSIVVRSPHALQATDGIRCRTSNGGITVALAGGFGFNFNADTSNGSIRSEFPVLLDRLERRKHIRAMVDGGGAEVNLSTSNGSISLEKI